MSLDPDLVGPGVVLTQGAAAAAEPSCLRPRVSYTAVIF